MALAMIQDHWNNAYEAIMVDAEPTNPASVWYQIIN